MIVRTILPYLVAAVALVLLPMAASAHVHLDRAEPAKDAVVGESPRTVKLWFSGRIEADFSKISVESADGQQVDTGEIIASDDQRGVAVGLNELPPGDYHVHWNVVARDGHRLTGDYSFTVE